MSASSLTHRIKAQVSLRTEVSKTVQYRNGHGGKATCKCPFHDDTSPSMSLNFEKSYFRCWACGARGSVIDWVMLREGFGLYEAVDYLAEQYGVVKDSDPLWEARRAVVLRNRQKAKDAHEALATKQGPLEYLRSRHILEDTIQTYQLGAGDGCVVIPFHDAWGEMAGFAFRYTDPNRKPKYINSSASEGFDKGSNLYGLSAARRILKDRLYVVEGYFDVYSAHQAGFPAVGICTSKMTTEQAELIGSTLIDGESVVLVPDQDKVGRDRCADNINLLLARAPKVPVYVVDVPEKDLGDYLGQPEEVKALLGKAMNANEWLVRKALKDEPDRDAQMRAIEVLAKGISNPIERDSLAQLLSVVWSKDLSVVRDFLGTAKDRGRIDPSNLLSVGFSVLEFVNRGDGYHPGFPSIDRITRGVSGGEVMGIMARSGVGKTTVSLNIARNLIHKYPDAPGIFFSMEQQVGPVELRLAQIEFDKSRDGVIDYLTFGGEQELKDRFSNLLVVQEGGLSVDDIDEYIGLASGRRFAASVGWVVIDYLGYIRPPRGAADGYQAVSQNARAIKQLAKKHNCAIFLLVQTSRGNGGTGAEPVTMDAARDSGAIEESVDFMLGFWRPSLATPGSILRYDTMMCRLLKNRNGSPAEVSMTFDTNSLRVYEGVAAQMKERTA